jgi:hypothetical protein
VLRTYTSHYNRERPHRALALHPPESATAIDRPRSAQSIATTYSADSSTSTIEPQREHGFETLQGQTSRSSDDH